LFSFCCARSSGKKTIVLCAPCENPAILCYYPLHYSQKAASNNSSCGSLDGQTIRVATATCCRRRVDGEKVGDATVSVVLVLLRWKSKTF
jgi:hypothetical protein